MTDLVIRPARVGDAQGMIDVVNPLIRRGDTTAIAAEYALDEQEAFLRNMDPREACHVAVDGGRVVGFQCIDLHPLLPPHVADISTFVRIGEKGRGVGSRLTAATIEAAKEAGFIEINATIRADNFEGLGFYIAMGFRDHAITRAKPLISGKMVDRISKRRRL